MRKQCYCRIKLYMMQSGSECRACCCCCWLLPKLVPRQVFFLYLNFATTVDKDSDTCSVSRVIDRVSFFSIRLETDHGMKRAPSIFCCYLLWQTLTMHNRISISISYLIFHLHGFMCSQWHDNNGSLFLACFIMKVEAAAAAWWGDRRWQ